MVERFIYTEEVAGSIPASPTNLLFNLMDQLSELESRIAKIEERNKSVELDKKWEGSFTRRTLLMIFTYLAIFLYFVAIDIPSPYLNAVVPTIGFLLSTLTLPAFKKIWMKWNKRD